MPVIVVPLGCLIIPAPLYSGTTASKRLNIASKIATSITCPFPSFCLCIMAKSIPKAAWIQASVSPILRLGLTGGSPGTPFTNLSPPNASQTEANPAFSA